MWRTLPVILKPIRYNSNYQGNETFIVIHVDADKVVLSHTGTCDMSVV